MSVYKMHNHWQAPFKQATEVLSVIEDNGYEAYFVGGCVRDLILKRPIKDIDIASAASPEEVMELFESVIPVGIEHGTVIVRYKQTSYEVTTFRHESTYTDQRRPDEVRFIRHIDEDLQRRDFTVNAIAMDRHGEIKDLFSGIQDLEKQVIRTVGDAEQRLMEDPLRILRGIRFTSQLGFTIDQATFNEMSRLKAEIETIAIERVTDELRKLFQGEFVQEGIEYIQQLDIHKHIPIWKDHPALLTKLPNNLTSFVSFEEVITLFHYMDPTIPIQTWTSAWKCSNKTKKAALQLFVALEYYFQNGIDNWLVYSLPKEAYEDLSHLIFLLNQEEIIANLSLQYEELTMTSRAQLNIDGNDLQQLFTGRRKGRWIKESIEKIEYEVVMGRLLNTKKAIKEWILCHPPEIN